MIALTFASGRKVVYKPKDLGTEEAYHRLLFWCNKRGMPLPFKVLKVINRSSHGWVEFVEHELCKDQEEGRRYYRRAGMLMCLVYALEGTDCHYENLIANGEHPVLVDMETLMHHRPRLEGMDEGALAQLLAHEQLEHSLLRTGFLPRWEVSNDERVAYDVSGLGDGGERKPVISAPQWKHINTDRMVLESEPVKMGAPTNVPIPDGVPLRLEKYGEEVVAGFQHMYCFLLDQREALLAPESLLYKFAHEQVRFVYRDTRVYFSIMQKLLNPKYLRDGADRSIQLELLGRAAIPLEGPLRAKGELPRWWSVFPAERKAMEQADVPFFTARASNDMLIIAPGQEIEGCLLGPSFDLVVARLKMLSEEDLERQVELILGSLYANVARDVAHMPAVNSTDIDKSLDAAGLTSERLVAQALSIAQQITTRAIRAADGSAAWIAPQYLMSAERYQLQPLGYGLYDGTCGVALFLAAMEKISGGAGYRKLALGAVRPLGQALRDYGNRTSRDMGIGGASGLGSVIYALTRMSQWLDEPALLEDARRAASLITVKQIADDKALDIIAGAAGTILGLLALYDVSGEQTVLDKAITCGQHLLRTRTESKTGWWAWSTINGKMLTGFSHGAAGIVYALLRLYAVTQDRDLLAAAQDGIAYEDSVFAPLVGNWPDLREEEQLAFMTSWCHGAPGIALARIGGLPVLDTDHIRKDIEAALRTTRAFGVQGVDHLCCGNLGRADLLLVAASRLSRPELSVAASKRAWQVLKNAGHTGAFVLHPQLPMGVYSPGFFQGTAGIGYALLRMAQPDVLPSVLLWE